MKITYAALACAVISAGCLPHIPMHTEEHLEVKWRRSYAAAATEAAATGQPLMVVLASGEVDGATCPGADFLRSDALRDPRVIALANRSFVPVWMNVRTTPLPAWPFLKDVLVTAKLDADNRVVDKWSRTFFVHTILVSPDGQVLLNPGAKTVAQTAKALLFDGNFSYEMLEAGEYLGALQRALAKVEDARVRTALR